MADRDQSLNDLLTTLHPKNQSSVDLYPRTVKNLSFAYNLVVNTNGQQFTGYKWVEVDSPVGGDYTVKQFCYSPSDDRVDDMSTIKAYLKFMTGTDFVPVYNAAEPNDMFVYLSSSEEVWKYQYDPSYGLVVFKVNNFPFALKSDIPEISALPKTIEVQGVADTEYNRIYFDINDDNLSEVKATSVRIQLEENNKDHWGNYFAESVRGSVVFKAGEEILQNVNCRYDSFEGTSARFELLIDSSNPEVDLTDLNFANATITLY